MIKTKTKEGKFTKTFMSIVAFVIILATIISAASADVLAFRIGNWDISKEGIINSKETSTGIQTTTTTIRNSGTDSEIRTKNQIQLQVQNRTRANLVDFKNMANNDTILKSYSRKFASENFCVETEERVAYVTVSESGKFSLLGSKPSDCYKVKTTEEFANTIYAKAKNGQTINIEEVENNVKIPWSLKLKLMAQNIFS